jgi:hypothetical protein
MHATQIDSASAASRVHSTGLTGGGIGDFLQDPDVAIHRLSMDPEKPSNSEWLKKYWAHLDSPTWRKLKNAVFEREGGICQGCASEPIEHTHHLSYAHMGDEFLFELMGLCITCHHRVHGVQKFKQAFK